MTAAVLGTCQHCEKKCDKGSACCHECRWSNQRAQQGPRWFWSKVDADGECWLWRGYLMHKNYGQFRGFDGKTILAHRQAWILAYGSVPDGLWVLHACDEPRCVRPDHLFLGTSDDNIADMVSKRRHIVPKNLPRGRRHPNAIKHLTADDAAAIRRRWASGDRRGSIASEFGTSVDTARKIAKGEHWLCR